MQIIGLAGAAGSGKSEAARIIAECYPDGACVVLPFAEPLKELCRDEFGWDGEKDARGRRLLQVVGTDAGRAYNPEIWVDKWLVAVDSARRSGALCIIADDVRFENESNAIRDLGGTVWQVERPGLIMISGTPRASMWKRFVWFVLRRPKMVAAVSPRHVSELPLPARCIDATIRNDGSKRKLQYMVMERTLRLLEGGAE